MALLRIENKQLNLGRSKMADKLKNEAEVERFNKKKFDGLEGFKKIGYLMRILKIDVIDVAKILLVDGIIVKKVCESGNVFSGLNLQDHRAVFTRFCAFLSLLEYLLKISRYHHFVFLGLFLEGVMTDRFFEQVSIKPPWFGQSVFNFLTEKQTEGLEMCIDWIKQNQENS